MTFKIAEIGVNHNGSHGIAVELAAEAMRAGVDAVKFQAFDPDRLAEKGSKKHDLLSWLKLSDDALSSIAESCKQLGVEFMCTPFDPYHLDLIASLGVKRIKISSGSVTNLPFMAAVGNVGLPIIISNGMCNDMQMEAALSKLRGHVTILYCVSKYPTPETDIHLEEIDRLKKRFGCPVGYSDHTTGLFASVAAAAAGAVVVEKHFTKSRNQIGPDHVCSMEPGEIHAWVREIDGAANRRGLE